MKLKSPLPPSSPNSLSKRLGMESGAARLSCESLGPVQSVFISCGLSTPFMTLFWRKKTALQRLGSINFPHHLLLLRCL